MAKQFPTVSARYGAPMGRMSAPDLLTAPRSVRLFAVRLDGGGYDDGGAYWGPRPRGARLWCARDKDGNEQFTDAATRKEAAFRLELPAPALRVPFDYAEWCHAAIARGLDRDDVTAYRAACDMVAAERVPTRVVFRKWKDGGVIALFPDIAEDRRGARYACSCFEHVGQHEAADPDVVIRATRPATPEEYAPLKRELESAPYFYRLAVRRRR